MKVSKFTKKLLIIVSILCVAMLLSGCYLWEGKDNEPQKEYVTVEYLMVGTYQDGTLTDPSPTEYGQIIGESRQWILKGSDTTAVTIVPKTGYKFIKWQDTESDNPTRNDLNIQQNSRFYAIMEGPITFTFNFIAGKGGTVEGELKQNILYGTSGKTVTAIPDEGYRFVQWSDGDKNAVRKNENVVSNYIDKDGFPNITAEFERYERNFKYVYNDATAGNDDANVSINLDNVDTLKLLVPQRDGYLFEGWYSDWHHTVKVADANGTLTVGKEWLNNDYIYSQTNPEGFLYAKWKAETAVPTFKILMPFVTEIHATLECTDSEKIVVDYCMTDVERQICRTIVERLGNYLNAILNGTVNFEVECYFTETPLKQANLFNAPVEFENGTKHDDYHVDLAEIDSIKDDYDAVLITFSLNDYYNKLHSGVGSAGTGKEAQIYLENLTRYCHNRYPLTVLTDFSIDGVFSAWESALEVYIHEFIHLLESRFTIMDNVGLHMAMGSIITTNAFDVMIPFLKGEFILNGEQIGIKPECWKTLNY